MKNSYQNIISFPSSVQKVRGVGVAKQPAVSGRPSTSAAASADIVSLAECRAETMAAQVKEPSNGPLSLGEVWDASDEGRIEMHYQPQYDLNTGEVMAAEALLRLIDVEGRLVFPDRFIELTERQRLASTGEGVEALEILAARGARIAIDDFGIGYSSVLCLTELPISALKLDRALISRLPENKAIQSVVRCLLDLATHLDLAVVAEGVETTAQHDWLSAAGCECGQGFGYARPMAIEPLRSLLGTPTVKARKLIDQ